MSGSIFTDWEKAKNFSDLVYFQKARQAAKTLSLPLLENFMHNYENDRRWTVVANATDPAARELREVRRVLAHPR